MYTLRVFRALCVGAKLYFRGRSRSLDLSILPPQFVVFDLETTGLSPSDDEIIEIGAIRVNRDSRVHQTLHALVKPRRAIPPKISALTGITQSMVDRGGEPFERAINDFFEFAGDLPLVAFNAKFDMAFLQAATCEVRAGQPINNRVSCALKMSRRAWPGLRSYRLSDLARLGGLSLDDEHRSLGDCRRTLTVYTGAATKLRSGIAQIAN